MPFPSPLLEPANIQLPKCIPIGQEILPTEILQELPSLRQELVIGPPCCFILSVLGYVLLDVLDAYCQTGHYIRKEAWVSQSVKPLSLINAMPYG